MKSKELALKGPTPAECRFNACKIWIDNFGESKSIVNGVIVMVQFNSTFPRPRAIDGRVVDSLTSKFNELAET